MEFDRSAPGSGLEILTTIQGGKAYLEGRLYLRQEEQTATPLPLHEEAYLDIRIWDRENRLTFSCRYPLSQEEPMKGIILHPKLWQGTENPYLYRVQAILMKQENCVADILEKKLALRNLEEIPLKGWFLNGHPFQIRAVEYEIFSAACSSSLQQQLRRDLEQIKEMGANAVCPIGEMDILKEILLEICDELGLIILPQNQAEGEATQEKYPRFGEMKKYYYKACWSQEPFVYISMDSLVLASNNSAKIVVYSNQKKVALYVDGVLFEFRTEGPDFIFEEIPIKQFPIMLTAETGECSMSVTVYPGYEDFKPFLF